jgi:DNA-binding protein HU-beta
VTVNKAELIDAIRDRLGVDRRHADEAVEAVLDTIQRAVAKGEKVALTGFGVFERIERPARTARNPATGATVKVKKTSVPKFRPGTGFKDVVSGAKKLGKVAEAAGKAGAKSLAGSSRSTARTAAAAPGKASAAAQKAATRAQKAPARATAKKAAPAKSAAKKTAAKKTTAKKTTARKTAAKKA